MARLGPITAASVLGVSVLFGAPTAPPAASAQAPARSNVLFVLTDDMRLDDMQFMPQVRQLVADQGASFDNELDNVTLCCPARTSILRGQYSHNTGVLTNGGSNGGFEVAHAGNVEQATVATALHDAGYLAGLFGKYLNGYPNGATQSYIPPGWDDWASSVRGNAYGEYGYTLNENGREVQYGRQPSDYGTDVYVRLTRDFINQAAERGVPFFAYLAVYAPHQPATPAPQDEQAFPGLQAPRTAAFDEQNVADKPQFIRDLPRLTVRELGNIDNLYRRRAQSLQAVDRGVAELIDQLRQNGQLDNTYVIFTSDNGFHLGEHRMPAGKQTAYETDIHLPLYVRGPGITAGSHVSALTGNIDLAPTIADIAGTSLADNPDGRSLLALLTGEAPPAWRQAYLLEHWTERATPTPQDRSAAGQLEPDDPDQGGVTPGDNTSARRPAAAFVKLPEFVGLRTATYTYVEYVTGERELYDLGQDPLELTNLVTTADPSLLGALHNRVADLAACAAEGCRAAENQPLIDDQSVSSHPDG